MCDISVVKRRSVWQSARLFLQSSSQQCPILTPGTLPGPKRVVCAHSCPTLCSPQTVVHQAHGHSWFPKGRGCSSAVCHNENQKYLVSGANSYHTRCHFCKIIKEGTDCLRWNSQCLSHAWEGDRKKKKRTFFSLIRFYWLASYELLPGGVPFHKRQCTLRTS